MGSSTSGRLSKSSYVFSRSSLRLKASACSSPSSSDSASAIAHSELCLTTSTSTSVREVSFRIRSCSADSLKRSSRRRNTSFSWFSTFAWLPSASESSAATHAVLCVTTSISMSQRGPSFCNASRPEECRCSRRRNTSSTSATAGPSPTSSSRPSAGAHSSLCRKTPTSMSPRAVSFLSASSRLASSRSRLPVSASFSSSSNGAAVDAAGASATSAGEPTPGASVAPTWLGCCMSASGAGVRSATLCGSSGVAAPSAGAASGWAAVRSPLGSSACSRPSAPVTPGGCAMSSGEGRSASAGAGSAGAAASLSVACISDSAASARVAIAGACAKS
mmetsp:Transcript_18910/g.54736  ORF Transcript_18910/g.54736 Transcript_18910/m.54736 type:complete len:333 (+) Transcript_18910:1459-2457(+)